MWRLSILLARPGKENGAARKPLHRGRPPHRNSKGTAFRLFLYIRVFSCVMNTRHGAGDRTRTGTLSPAVDFESTTSTNSITPAGARDIIHDSRRFCKCRKNFLDRELVGARYIRISLQAHSPDRLFILCRSAGDTLFDILLLQHDRAGYARVFKDRSAHGVHGADHRHGVPAEHTAGKVLHPWSLPHLYFASRCGIALRRPDTGMAQQDLDREAVNAKHTVRYIKTA